MPRRSGARRARGVRTKRVAPPRRQGPPESGAGMASGPQSKFSACDNSQEGQKKVWREWRGVQGVAVAQGTPAPPSDMPRRPSRIEWPLCAGSTTSHLSHFTRGSASSYRPTMYEDRPTRARPHQVQDRPARTVPAHRTYIPKEAGTTWFRPRQFGGRYKI